MPRTILDCAPTMSARRLERLINEADVLRLHDRLSIPDLLYRYPRRPGSRKLSEALSKRNAGATRTRSDLEELLVELVDELALQRPEFNVEIEVDGKPSRSTPSGGTSASPSSSTAANSITRPWRSSVTAVATAS